jgi:hypothetical protein
VENVMSWPGLGRLLLESVQAQDLYVAMGAFVMGGVLADYRQPDRRHFAGCHRPAHQI